MIKYVNVDKTNLYHDSTTNSVKLELLWGDRVQLISNTKKNGRYQVKARWAKDGYVEADRVGDESLLELYFIDVGQGDGVLIVTPDRKHILIDGGYKRSKQPHGKSAADFVDWKFKKDYGKDTIDLDAMICSHCDADHYGGLWDLFIRDGDDNELDTNSTNVKRFYHAGVSWWKDDNHSRFLGEERDGMLFDLLNGKKSIVDGLKNTSALRLQGEWAEFLKCIKQSETKVDRIAYNPSKGFEYLPGFEKNKVTSIKILGPIEKLNDGKPTLKDFGGHPKNTNGNSILLRVEYGSSRILLTGDLNKKSQRYIIESLVGNTQELAADVVKSCHHGSHDCSYEFLQYVNAAATIISSGDDEKHAHPRPNIVAASGVTGFIKIHNDEMITPLIYSTEISRSVKLGNPYKVNFKNYNSTKGFVDVELLDEKKTNISYKRTPSGALSAEDKTKTMDKLNIIDGIVYGLVNVRTDGSKILCAILNEGKSKWEIQTFKSRF